MSSWWLARVCRLVLSQIPRELDYAVGAGLENAQFGHQEQG